MTTQVPQHPWRCCMGNFNLFILPDLVLQFDRISELNSKFHNCNILRIHAGSFAHLLKTLHGCSIFLVLHGCCSCTWQARVKPVWKKWSEWIAWKHKIWRIRSTGRTWCFKVNRLHQLTYIVNIMFIIRLQHERIDDWPARCLEHASLVCHTLSFHLLSVTTLQTGNS